MSPDAAAIVAALSVGYLIVGSVVVLTCLTVAYRNRGGVRRGR